MSKLRILLTLCCTSSIHRHKFVITSMLVTQFSKLSKHFFTFYIKTDSVFPYSSPSKTVISNHAILHPHTWPHIPPADRTHSHFFLNFSANLRNRRVYKIAQLLSTILTSDRRVRHSWAALWFKLLNWKLLDFTH